MFNNFIRQIIGCTLLDFIHSKNGFIHALRFFSRRFTTNIESSSLFLSAVMTFVVKINADAPLCCTVG